MITYTENDKEFYKYEELIKNREVRFTIKQIFKEKSFTLYGFVLILVKLLYLS